MKYFASLFALLLAGSMPGFSSVHPTGPNPENQFHFKPTGKRALANSMKTARFESRLPFDHQFGRQPGQIGPTSQTQAQSSKSRSHTHRLTANPPAGKIGLVSATQIPAGGAIPNGQSGPGPSPAIAGDFNGDGKIDVATIVTDGSGNYYISAVLSNGDGTFKTAVLTAVPGNDSNAQIVVGDVNGDKKDDVIVAHQNGNDSSCTSSCFDVLLSNGDGTFTAGNNYAVTTNNLAGGVLAAVNGKLDVVVVDQANPANVWTLTGNGDGTFNPPTSVALSGEAGNSVAFADFNGDGLLDIADIDYNSYQVTVYLATSATTYANGVSYTTPDGIYDACSLTAGDINGDGKPEIVTPNCGDDSVTVYVNQGDGTFPSAGGVYYSAGLSAAAGGYPADVYPEAVTIADVNGDGYGDIVSSNFSSNSVYGSSDMTILLGSSQGTVSQPTVGYAVGGYPNTPAIVADFNGDGHPDILVADEEYSLVFLKGYGDGTFRAALDYYSPIPDYQSRVVEYSIATGDFNGDGVPDFVVGNCCFDSDGITVFLSRPDGSMQPGVIYGSGSFLPFVVVADFNKDGKLDIAAVDYLNGVVQVFSGVGDGTFSASSSFPTDTSNTYPTGLVAGDFNNDGYPDLAVENSNGQNVGVLLYDPTNPGNFNPPVTYALSAYVFDGIATADLTGKGNLSLVAPLNNASAVAVLLGNGDGTFQPEADVDLSGLGSDPGAVAIADLNGDGIPDLAVTMPYTPGIAVAMGNGDGTFGTLQNPPVLLASSLNVGNPQPEFIQAADIDGDGNVDLVYTNSGYSTVGVLFNIGGKTGTFYDPVEYPAGGSAYGLVVADVNQDGAPDVITADSDFAGATVLLNANGSGALGSYTIGTNVQGATITAGQSATFTLTITPSNHYNGTVTFTCPSGLPALATCTFSPSSVTLDGLTPMTVQMTITTTAPTASLQMPAGMDENPHHRSSAMLLASLNGMGVFGMVLAGGFGKKRNRWDVLGILALAMCLFLVGCGGSSSTTTTNPPPTKANTTSSVSSSAATVLVGLPVTFTGKVSASSGTPTGTVTFLDGTTKLGTGTLSSGSATFQTSSLAAGVHNVTVSYSGDSNFNASTSTALSQTVDKLGTATGNYSVTVTATGTAGTNGVKSANQSMKLTVIVQ